MQQREPIVRRARPMDAEVIARLNNGFASEGLMLYRTPAMVSSQGVIHAFATVPRAFALTSARSVAS